MAQIYKCQIYYAGKAFIIGFPIFLITTIIIILLGRFLNIQPELGVVLVIMFWVSPFLFQKRIKNKFTKNAMLEFDDKSFSITTSNLDNPETASNLTYNWNEIKAYKFYFTPSKLTYMDIYLRDGRHREFGFKDNKTEEESINSESVFSIFYSYIKEYNLSKEEHEKINFVPGLFAKPIGIILLCVLAVLIVIDIILHVLKYDNNIGFIVFGAAIFLGLLAQRMRQKKFYERMSKL